MTLYPASHRLSSVKSGMAFGKPSTHLPLDVEKPVLFSRLLLDVLHPIIELNFGHLGCEGLISRNDNIVRHQLLCGEALFVAMIYGGSDESARDMLGNLHLPI